VLDYKTVRIIIQYIHLSKFLQVFFVCNSPDTRAAQRIRGVLHIDISYSCWFRSTKFPLYVSVVSSVSIMHDKERGGCESVFRAEEVHGGVHKGSGYTTTVDAETERLPDRRLPSSIALIMKISAVMSSGLTLRLLMSYIYGAHFLDVSISHTTTQHSR